MSDLSASEIQDFLKPYAFSRPRGESATQKTASGAELPAFGESKLLTTSLSQSVNVLRSSYDRLEQILGNLSSSKKLAEEAALSSDSTLRDEAYAKLRSLAGGIDVLADQSRFNNQRMLDGSPATLASNSAGGTQVLDLRNMMTFGEDSLQLVEYVDDARVEAYVSESAQQLNSNVKFNGISVDSASYSPPADPEDEIEDGDYRLQIIYEGEHSTVHLTNAYLEPVATMEDVDLSGDGTEVVDFGNGISIEIGKSTAYSPIGVDKWDYERRGPVDYLANVSYLKVRRQDLLVDSDEKFIRDASLKSADTVTTDDGGTLSFGVPDYNPTNVTEDTLEPGKYSVKVNYFGANSTISLRDESGRIVEMKSSVDLGQNGPNLVTFENGLVVNINNDGVGRIPEELSATIEIEEVKSVVRQDVALVEDSEVNASSDTGSLMLSDVSSGARAAEEDRLENGEYSLELRYAGENSVASIRDADGNLVSFVSGLDFSSEGTNEVDLGNGVKITLENTTFGEDIATVSAKFTVSDKARSANQEAQDTSAKAELLTSNRLEDDEGGSLEITEFRTGALFPEEEPLEAGDYTVEVHYFGKFSIVTLKGEDGRPIKYEAPVDLSRDTASLVSFQNGLDFVLDNRNFSDTGEKVTATVRYEPEKTGVSAAFDFAAYAKQVEQSMEVIQEQMTLVDDTFYTINIQKQLSEQYQQIARNATNSAGANAITLLSNSVNSDTVSVFSAGRSNSQAAQNIQMILATAGTSQASNYQYSAADIISSSGNLDQNSVLGILSGQSSGSSSIAGII